MRISSPPLARLVLVTAVLAAGRGTALGGGSARQVLTYRIDAIHELALGNAPGPFRLTPGSGATAAGTYALTTNTPGRITAQLDSALPEGLSLRAGLEAPTGATSRGDQVLSTEPVDLVVDIPKTAHAHRTITYTLSAASSTRGDLQGGATVTLTVTE